MNDPILKAHHLVAAALTALQQAQGDEASASCRIAAVQLADLCIHGALEQLEFSGVKDGYAVGALRKWDNWPSGLRLNRTLPLRKAKLLLGVHRYRLLIGQLFDYLLGKLPLST